MSINLPGKLRSWAQNEEMIDQYYTEHGEDCNEAADLLDFYYEQNIALLKREDELLDECAQLKEGYTTQRVTNANAMRRIVEENQRLRLELSSNGGV